ncbi:hypothetical protein PIB30_008430 [Stylosanthes scabra]|uniref:Uncharacterized protein n=1 Tax=Stylosanthes scabra TaxID=79078 RepID=A0ABU6W610_9FABA|nr:hypothetical protein [Stylosanthes scabra]
MPFRELRVNVNDNKDGMYKRRMYREEMKTSGNSLAHELAKSSEANMIPREWTTTPLPWVMQMGNQDVVAAAKAASMGYSNKPIYSSRGNQA